MIRDCCMCKCRAEVRIVFGEYVCHRCHEMVTGEKPPKMIEVKRAKKTARTLPKRQQVRSFLIIENLKNTVRRRYYGL